MESFITLKIILVAALGFAAQWLAWRFKFPALVLLILFGVLAGPVFGWLDPPTDFGESYEVIVRLALAFVLFEGGLQLRVFELKTVKAVVKRLCSLGIFLAWIFGTAAGHYIGGLSWPIATLLAAILTVTGPTVILPILRQAGLAPNPSYILKWEGIVNDPLGALLAVLVFEYIIYSNAGHGGGWFGGGAGDVLVSIAAAVGVSAALATASTAVLKFVFERDQLPEFLKIPAILALILSVYEVANLVQEEAGLMAVTLFGLLVGQMRYPIIEELRRFKEYITVMIVSAVFILLTADLDPLILSELTGPSLGLLLAFLFLVRPAAVFLAMLGTDTSWKERTIIAWVAPRGVVAAGMAGLFAPELIRNGYEDARLILPLVFGMVFLTVTAHGFTIRLLGRILGLATEKRSGLLIVGASSWTTELARTLKESGLKVLLADSNWHRLRDARAYGVATFYGEVLSPIGEEHLHLTEISDLLAATENDAYNTLVCSHFMPQLGSNHVFQLPLHTSTQEGKKGLSKSQLGRIALGRGNVLERLLVDHYRGWKFHRTKITESFSMEDVRKRSEQLIPVLVLRKDGDIELNSEAHPADPEPGETLVSFVPAEADTQKGMPHVEQ